MIPAKLLPVNGEFGLGEPFDRHADLLLKYDAARRALQAAQVDGDPDAIRSAEWAVTEALADLERHERDLSEAVLMALRFAAKWHPVSLSDIISEVPAVVEIADAVAVLERREGVSA